MTDHEFDQALIAGAFTLAAQRGWACVSPVSAAREAGLALDRARARFADGRAILLRFGRLADEAALTDALESGAPRERLFDLLMRRLDALQHHRPGMLALLRGLPADPLTALMLAGATAGSMGWMLEAAAIPARGLRGAACVQGLTGVWLYAVQAWRTDESADLSVTMAALDRALSRAERVAGWLGQAATTAAEPEPGPKPFPDPEVEDAASLAGIASGAADIPAPGL